MVEVLLAVAGVLFVLVLTAGTGAAVAAEFSLTSLERSTVDSHVRQVDDRRSRSVRNAHRTLSFQLSGAQVAITLTTLITGYVAEPLIGELLRPALVATGIPGPASAAVSLVLAIMLATTLSMVFGEMVPKNLAIARPLPTARVVSGYHNRFSHMFGWMISGLNNSANWIVRRLGAEPQEELRSARSPQELGSIVRSSAERGTLDPSTAALLDRSLRFGDRTADELMTPRVRMSALAAEDTVADLIELARSSGHSRFPVHSGDLDDVHGLVHIKQAFSAGPDDRDRTAVGPLARPVPRVPETLIGDALLETLRSSGQGMGVVVDEYGGTAGIVTVEDLVEEIVGDVRDEHDPAYGPAVRALDEDSWTVSGLLRPDELTEATGAVLPEGDYDTLAGFVLVQLGRLPEVGAGVSVPGWQFEVIRMDGNRVAELLLVHRPDTEETADDDR